MELNRKKLFIISISLSLFFISGCASLGKLILGKQGIEIPQIVAYLEPVLRENKITILGKIVIQNPTQSDLGLDKIYLDIQDENNNILGRDILQWEKPNVVSKKELESPVEINLSLAALNNKSIGIFIRTAFIYKTLGLRIPIESKVAVLDLDALKETIARPLYVTVYTKFRANILGNASINYVLGITNPLSIDLVLEDGEIGIYTLRGEGVAKSQFIRTLFKGSQSNEIKGTIKIGNILGKLIGSEFIKRRPLRFQLSGKLRVPNTDISMPFKIESIQAIDLSLFE